MQMLRKNGELKYCFRGKLYTSGAMCTLTYILTVVRVFSFLLHLCWHSSIIYENEERTVWATLGQLAKSVCPRGYLMDVVADVGIEAIELDLKDRRKKIIPRAVSVSVIHVYCYSASMFNCYAFRCHCFIRMYLFFVADVYIVR